MRLIRLVDHKYRLKIEVGLKQTLVEHLHKHFAMKTFDHLELPFADDQLDNFLVTLKGCPQHYNCFFKVATSIGLIHFYYFGKNWH